MHTFKRLVMVLAFIFLLQSIFPIISNQLSKPIGETLVGRNVYFDGEIFLYHYRFHNYDKYVRADGSIKQVFYPDGHYVYDLLKGAWVEKGKAWLPLEWPSIPQVKATTTTFYSVADAQVHNTEPNTNLGSQNVMEIRPESDSDIRRPYWRFDISSIPAGATINSAQTKLYANWVWVKTTHTIRLYRPTASWGEYSITWNNQPSVVDTGYVFSGYLSDGYWITWDCKSVVQGWVSGSFPNYGFNAREPSGPSGHIQVHSRENSNDPQLIVDYTTVPTYYLKVRMFDSGLIAYYPMDENTGSQVRDNSANNNHGAITSASWTNGKYGKALSFSGTSYVSLSNLPVNTASGGKNTVVFWMYWTGGDSQMPFGWQQAYDLYFASGSFGFNTGEGNVLGISSSGLANQWVHVAAVFYNGVPSPSTVALYINGVSQTLTQRVGSTTQSRSATSSAQISGWAYGSGYYFGGIIDDFRIYNRELSADEVKLLYYTSAPSGSGYYTQGSVASFSAQASVEFEGKYYYCTGYSGSASGSSNSGTITMDSDKYIVFSYAQGKTLTWTANGLPGQPTSMSRTTYGKIWYDTFDSDTRGYYNAYQVQSWSVSGGQLYVQGSGAGGSFQSYGYRVVYSTAMSGTYVFEVDQYYYADNGDRWWGIEWNHQSEGYCNKLGFKIDSTNERPIWGRQQGTTWTQAGYANNWIGTGRWYTWVVYKTGTTFYVAVGTRGSSWSDAASVSWSDGTWSSGKVGISGHKSIVYVDNFKIYRDRYIVFNGVPSGYTVYIKDSSGNTVVSGTSTGSQLSLDIWGKVSRPPYRRIEIYDAGGALKYNSESAGQFVNDVWGGDVYSFTPGTSYTVPLTVGGSKVADIPPQYSKGYAPGSDITFSTVFSTVCGSTSYFFSHWALSGNPVSMNPSLTVNNIQSDYSFTAVYGTTRKAYLQVVGATTPFILFPIEEGSGSVIKDISGSYQGNIPSGVSWVAGRQPGSYALQFDGSNHIEVLADVPEANFVIEVEFKTTAANTGIFSVLAGANGGSGHDRHIYVSGGKIAFRVWKGGGWVTDKVVNDGGWHRVILIVRQGLGQLAYVDGQLVGFYPYDHSDFNWQDRIGIGWSNDGGGNFNGAIDMVAIYSIQAGSGDSLVNAFSSAVAIDDFDDGSTSGWGFNAISASEDYYTGVLSGTITAGDPYMYKDCVDFSGSSYPYVIVRMAVNSPGTTSAQIFWVNDQGGWSETRSQHFNIINDGAFHTYVIDLSSNPNWVGRTIQQFRIDPSDQGSSGTFKIDFIAAVPSQGASTSFSLSTTSISFGSDRRASFKEWELDYTGSGTSGSITVNSPKVAKARFVGEYKLTISVDDPARGTTNPAPGTYWYEAGSSISVTAIPASGYAFQYWELDGQNVGSANPITFRMDKPHSLVAHFVLSTSQITITSNPTGSGFVKVDGTPITTPQSFTWLIGSSHVLEAISPVSGGQGIQYVWVSWSDGGAQTHTYITPSSSQTVTAIFKTQYYITVISDHGNPTPSQWVDAGGSLTVSVTSPDGNYRCIGYKIDGGTLNSGTSYTFSNVQAPHTIEFEWGVEYKVTFDQSGSDVTIIATINGENHALPYTEWYGEGAQVQVSVPETVPGADGIRYVFLRWNDGVTTASRTITISAPATYTALYQKQYRLTVESDHGSPDPSVGEHWYAADSSVSVSVNSPVSGGTGVRYVCIGHIGTGSVTPGSELSFSFTITMPSTLKWVWQTEYLLTIKSSGLPPTSPAKVYLDGVEVGLVHDGQAFTKWIVENGQTGTIGVDAELSAPSGGRYLFIKWSEDGSTANPRPSTQMTSPTTFTAVYSLQYKLTIQTNGLPGGTFVTSLRINGVTVATGIKDGSPWSQWFDAGTTLSNIDIDTPIVSGGERRVFTGWSGDYEGTTTPIPSITMDKSKTITANYKTEYKVTVDSEPFQGVKVYVDGSSTPSGQTPCEIWISPGSHSFGVEAEVEHDGIAYIFKEWSGDASGSENPVSIQVNGEMSLTAHYVKKTYTITIQLKRTDGSNITLAGARFSITYEENSYPIETNEYGRAVKEEIPNGVSVTVRCLTTVVSGGEGIQYIFVDWSGYASGSDPNGLTFTMPASNIGINSNYKTQYYLTVKTNPEGLELPPDNGEGWYDAGTQATAKCNAIIGDTSSRNVFIGWGGDASGSSTTSNPILMNGPKTAIANYKLQYMLSGTAEGLTEGDKAALIVNGMVVAEVPPAWVGWFDAGSTVQMMAESSRGFEFKYWELDGVRHDEDPLKVLMDGPHMAVAVFNPYKATPGIAFPVYSPVAQAFGAIMALAVLTLMIKRRKEQNSF